VVAAEAAQNESRQKAELRCAALERKCGGLEADVAALSGRDASLQTGVLSLQQVNGSHTCSLPGEL